MKKRHSLSLITKCCAILFPIAATFVVVADTVAGPLMPVPHWLVSTIPIMIPHTTIQPPSGSFSFVVDDVSVKPDSLKIPCGFWSCPGFEHDKSFEINVEFRADVFDPLFRRDTIKLTSYNLLLMEDDFGLTGFNNPVGTYTGTLSESIHTGITGVDSDFSFDIDVFAHQLNPHCPFGCDTRRGGIIEAGALEFIVDTDVSFVEGNIQGSPPVFRAYFNGRTYANLKGNWVPVPEPEFFAIFSVGMTILWLMNGVKVNSWRHLS
jgi:hypothetical protein